MPAHNDLPNLPKIVTTTYIRGVANLPCHSSMGVDVAQHSEDAMTMTEGPAVVVHGLSGCLPGVPNHFIALLEAGGRISVARLGAHLAHVEIIAGRCKLSCENVDTGAGVERYDSIGSGVFTIEGLVLTPRGTIASEISVFKVSDFPIDDSNIIYIESLGGVSILFLVRNESTVVGGGEVAVDKLAKASALPGYSSSLCTSGCPHVLVFPGQPAPMQG